MRNKLVLNINYISNFNNIFFKNFNKFKNKNKKKIICRNFFLFLFLLKFLKNFILCGDIRLFIKPKKFFFVNILKAPYKNKLSKNQIGFRKYLINFKFNIYINLHFFKNISQIIFFLNKFIVFFRFFETNIIYNYKIKLFFKFKIIKFFNF